MHDSRMIAEVAPPGCCAIEKVSGSRIATPLAPPRPGSTPMMTPRMMPANISITLNQESATAKPPSSDSISCIRALLLEAEQRFEGALGQGHLEPHLEHQEEDHHGAQRDRGDLRPRILAEMAHEERDEDHRRFVDA